jgi:hypothetical protein
MPNRIKALAKLLEVSESEIESNDNNQFSMGRQEWLVLTDEEADSMAEDYIRSSLWAFNLSFLQAHFKKEIFSTALESIEKMQRDLCEDSNEIIFCMISDFDHLVSDAVLCDGRGHFLSPYDSVEEEVKIDNIYYYLYRTN